MWLAKRNMGGGKFGIIAEMSKHAISGAQSLVESLEKAGVEKIFGYPGGNVIDIFDALSSARFDFVLARHEQGAVPPGRFSPHLHGGSA